MALSVALLCHDNDLFEHAKHRNRLFALFDHLRSGKVVIRETIHSNIRVPLTQVRSTAFDNPLRDNPDEDTIGTKLLRCPFEKCYFQAIARFFIKIVRRIDERKLKSAISTVPIGHEALKIRCTQHIVNALPRLLDTSDVWLDAIRQDRGEYRT